MRISIERVPEGGAIADDRSMSAEEYGRLMRSRLEPEYRRFAKEALGFAAPPRGGRVLEIGPGPGWAGIMLLAERPDLELEGLDVSVDMLRAAAANAEAEGLGSRASYREGSAELLEGVPDGSVDLVISRDSLHHWVEPERAFRSIGRVLRPSGSLFLADERRDLGAAAWALVYVLGAAMGGMARFWRSSIRASYTPGELRAMLPAVPDREWEVSGGLLGLKVGLGGRQRV